MTNFPWLLLELGVNLLQGFLFTYFLFGCLEIKRMKKAPAIPFLLCTLTVFGAISLCNLVVTFEGVAIFVYALILFLFAVIFCEGSILNKVFVAIVPVNASTVGSIFSVNLIAYITNQSVYDYIITNPGLRILAIVLSNGIFFTILFIIKKFTAKHTLKLKEAEWFLLSFNIALSVVAYMFLYYAIFNSNSLQANFFNSICAVVLIVINITMYVLLTNFSNRYQIQLENNLLRQQAKYQAETILETKKQYDELQKVRHDFKNVLGVIDHLNSSHKDEEITEYISEYLKSQNRSIHMIHTGNSFVNAIINSKLAEANECGIEVQISTVRDIDNEYSIDMCTLLGNLFDNAIRATMKSKQKTIKLDIRREIQTTIVSMKNSIDSPVLSVNPTLQSDKTDANNHGYGTKIIRDIAERYKGYVDFYEENEFFCCNVILYLGDTL